MNNNEIENGTKVRLPEVAKLKLNHLAPYLPYGLKCSIMGEFIDEYDEPRIAKIFTLNGVQTYPHDTTEVAMVSDNEYCHEPVISDVFPILRPLSDLTKEIKHNGDKFIPIDWLEDKYYTLSLNKEAERLLDEDGVNWVNHLSYLLIIHLLEWHFDIFNLIEEKLAIDINTLILKNGE